jgi:hypothetical protein
MPSRHNRVLALVDESGRLADPRDPLVVVAIVVAESTERRLDRLLAKIRRRLPSKGKRKHERRKTELKFNTTSPKTRRQVLHALTQQDVTLLVLVVNKRGVKIADSPKNYGELLCGILPDCLARFPQIDQILIDRHFSKQIDQDVTTRWILETLGQEIAIEHLDSRQDARIDLADFVAGAIAHTRLHQDATYEDLIRAKIAVYKVVDWKEKEKW